LLRLNDAGVPAVRVPALNVTVRTLDVKVACATGLLKMPLKPETAIVAVDVNPVRVTTTLLKLATLVGVKVTVTAAGVVLANALANVTPKDLNDGVIAGTVASVDESSTVESAIVAIPVVVADAAGPLIMLVNVTVTGVPAVNLAPKKLIWKTFGAQERAFTVNASAPEFNTPVAVTTDCVLPKVVPDRVITTLLKDAVVTGENDIVYVAWSFEIAELRVTPAHPRVPARALLM